MKELKNILIIVGIVLFLSVNDLNEITKDLQKQAITNMGGLKENWMALVIIAGLGYMIFKRRGEVKKWDVK
jgi:hypothetical protein